MEEQKLNEEQEQALRKTNEKTDSTSNDAKPKFYDGQKVIANWDGKLGTVRKLFRKPYYFNESYQYYIDWDNGHWGFASESELSPVI